ncbi:hypothetical protein Emed_002825 [Eimeria media]
MSSDKEGVGTSSDEEEVLSNRQRRKLQLQRKADAEDAATLAEPVGSASADASHAAVGDGWAHDQQPPMTGPCEVNYCPTCGMPFEYCEFSGAACSKQKEEHADGASQDQQPVQQLATELQEKAVIQETAKRPAGKDKSKEGDVEEKVAFFLEKQFTIPTDKIVFLPEK